MEFFDYYIPASIIVIIGLALWNFFEQRQLGRTEGSLKRGIRVWAEKLSWETCQKLESLPSIIDVEDGFVRKEGREVLITEKLPVISFGQRRRGIRYVGYINLSDPDSRIEFRTALAGLLTFVFILIFVLLSFSIFFSSISRENLPLFVILFPLIFLIMFTGSLLYNHYQERKRVMKLLNQVVNLPLQAA